MCPRTSGNDETRRLLLLQNAAFLPLFREEMRDRGEVRGLQIDEIEPLPPQATGPAAVREIFADVSRDPMAAFRKVLAYLNADGSPKPLIDMARRLVFLKGNDAHDYKFSSAVLEDFYHTSPSWRRRYLAASVFRLCGSEKRDNDLVRRTRSALSS